MEKRLWELCCDIIDYAYKNDKRIKLYKHLFIELVRKEMKSFNGDYSPKEHKIRLVNLKRDNEVIICTLLHELSHHIDYINRNTSDHSDKFYAVYKEVLKAALNMGIVTTVQLLSMKRTSSDNNKVKKIVKSLHIQNTHNYKEDKLLVQVYKAFEIKDKLKLNGYIWNSLSKAWEKEFNIYEKEIIINKLLEITTIDNIKIKPAISTTFEHYDDISIQNAYQFKEELKARGYHYSNKLWIKKISSENISNEIKELQSIGISKKDIMV